MCQYILGGFEIFHFWTCVFFIIPLIIAILSVFSFKTLLNRFGVLRSVRREFYECGFKPTMQHPVVFSVQFIFICFFFLIYDIELNFSFPLVSIFHLLSYLESLIFFFIYGSFILSLWFDFAVNLTNWRI